MSQNNVQEKHQGIVDKSINVMSDVETIKCTVVKMRRELGKTEHLAVESHLKDSAT